MNIKINTRVEKDLLGHKEIPAHCYYGVQTLRALENFNLSPNKLNQFPVFINALIGRFYRRVAQRVGCLLGGYHAT